MEQLFNYRQEIPLYYIPIQKYVIMLTAKSDEKDELQGFDLGVDEYIRNLSVRRILVARVEAILSEKQCVGGR